MICYVHGLILRHGDRLLAFKRKVNNQTIQFEYTDDGRIVTETIGENYRAIRNGKYKLSRAVYTTNKKDVIQIDEVALPIHLTEQQELSIALRMKYIKAALSARVAITSIPKLRCIIAETYDSIQKNKEIALQHFPVPSPSTLRGWLQRYKRNGSSAYVLVDKRSVVKRSKRIHSEVETIVDGIISKYYMKLNGDSVAGTHRRLSREISAINLSQGKNLIIPSCPTLNRRIKEIPDFIKDRSRFGAQYANNKWRFSLKGDQSTRVLERVELDHTLLDIWVLDPVSGVPLGRPWITVLIDRMSGYILGIHISFYGPSGATIASALRNSIEPKDEYCRSISSLKNEWNAYGVAELYVMDNGLEMHSKMFRRIGWELQTDFLYNPVRKPWLKPSIERTMQEVCRMLPAAGKVSAPRKNAIAPNPFETASILFDDLCDGLIIWACDDYPTQINRDLLIRPYDIWNEEMSSGPPLILPSSTTELELAMGIEIERTVGRDGVFFQYIRFNSVELQDYCRHFHQSFRGPIRMNPDDLGFIHVFLPKEMRWLKVDAVRPDQDYASGLSLLQHQIIRKEAGNKLKKLNAEEVLREARNRLQCHWEEATRRGKRLRRETDLIRLQGLTSARISKKPTNKESAVPEASSILKECFDLVNPYKAFTLEEE